MAQRLAIEYVLEKRPGPPAGAGPEGAPSGEPPPSLTRREQEVAALVARGLTDRRIAEELSISERTASTHVSRILKKLGLRSRDEVARSIRKKAYT